MNKEFIALKIAVDVVDEGLASGERHVKDVDGGKFFLFEVVSKHAAKNRRSRSQDSSVCTNAAISEIVSDIDPDVCVDTLN